jgi:hypothetical protein
VCLKRNFRDAKGDGGTIDSAPRALHDASKPWGHNVAKVQDGRCVAEIPALPGVMVYGNSRAEAVRSVQALAVHVLAEDL